MRALLKRLLPAQFRNWLRSRLPASSYRHHSYAQSGEDLLVLYLLELLFGQRPFRYLDIGANHPYHLSNTALLYEKGGDGLLVEPDPKYAALLRKRRPRDTVLECGVHFSGDKQADFYVMEPATLNTFSTEEMERYVAMGHRLQRTIQVDLLSINQILERAGNIDFMNVDVEGLDLAILSEIDWSRFRPACLCVETINYETEQEPVKVEAISNLLTQAGYIIYADSYINTIYVDGQRWMERWQRSDA